MSIYKGVQKVPGVVGEERMGIHQERQRDREQQEAQICPGRARVESPKALFCFAVGYVLVGVRLGIHPD